MKGSPIGLILFMTLFMSFTFTGNGQKGRFVNFNTNNGLPSNQVYQVTQDNNGYIWFATDKGFAKYDGKRFYSLNTPEMLDDPVVFRAEKTEDGLLWFHSLKNNIGYIKNDSIFHVLKSEKGYFHTSLNAFQNKIIVSHNTGYSIVDSSGILSKHSLHGENLVFIQDSSGIQPVNVAPFHNSNDFSYISYGDTIHKKIRNPFYWQTHSSGILTVSDTVYLSFGNLLLICANDSLIEIPLKGKICNAPFVDNSGKTWVGLYNIGLACIDNKSFQVNYLLDKYTVTSIFQDHEGGYWFSTLHNGVFYYEKTNFKVLFNEGTRHLLKHKNKLLYSSTASSTCIFNPSDEITFSKNYNVSFISTGIFNGQFVLISAYPTKITRPEKKLSQQEQNILPSHRFTQFSDQFSASFHENEIKIINNDDLSIKKYSLSLPLSTALHLIQLSEKKWIYNKRNGLYILRLQEDSLIVEHSHPTYTKSLLISGDTIIAATKSKGIIFFNHQLEVIDHLTTEDHLSSNFTNSLAAHQDTLFIGTNKGLSIITNWNNAQKRKIFSLDHRDGLSSNEIYKVVVKDHKLYIGSSEDLSVIPVHQVIPSPIQLKLNIEKINQTKVYNDTLLSFPSSINKLLIQYNGISFKKNNETRYEYRIREIDSTWTSTLANTIEFSHLSPGEYTFEVRSALPYPHINDSKSIRLHITPMLHQTTTFKLILMVLILVLLLSIIKYRENLLIKRNLLYINQEKLKHKALSAQMNPHFIFNSLGSIQSLIFQNENMKAAEYLAGFSNLMRGVLTNSSLFFVPLSEEINLINEYIRLEKFRFNTEFDFQLTICPQIDPNSLTVPTMMVQPFIENSILHGIRHSENKGEIQLKIQLAGDDFLEIYISDNGIGRKKAADLKTSSHNRSMALDLLKQRLSVFRVLFKKEFSYQVTDILDENNSVKGTQVLLTIPYKLKTNDKDLHIR